MEVSRHQFRLIFLSEHKGDEQTQEMYADGLASLGFEVVRNVKPHFHSFTSDILPVLLKQLIPREDLPEIAESRLRVLYSFVLRAAKHATRESGTDVLLSLSLLLRKLKNR